MSISRQKAQAAAKKVEQQIKMRQSSVKHRVVVNSNARKSRIDDPSELERMYVEASDFTFPEKADFIAKFDERLAKVEKQNEKLSKRLDNIEQGNRILSVVIFGIDVDHPEAPSRTFAKVSKLIDKHRIKAKLQQAFRVGKPHLDKTQRVVARFVSVGDKAEFLKVLKRGVIFEGNRVWARQDLPESKRKR